MNGTERLYAEILDLRIRAGEIKEWAFEVEGLKLADKTFYYPDFRVIMANDTIEFHEVKGGFIQEDGWLKLKIAAQIHPYKFFLCQLKKREGWSIKEV